MVVERDNILFKKWWSVKPTHVKLLLQEEGFLTNRETNSHEFLQY